MHATLLMCPVALHRELEVLAVDHNQLSSLPEAICHLPCLREVHVAHNQLRELQGPWHLLTTLQVGA